MLKYTLKKSVTILLHWLLGKYVNFYWLLEKMLPRNCESLAKLLQMHVNMKIGVVDITIHEWLLCNLVCNHFMLVSLSNRLPSNRC